MAQSQARPRALNGLHRWRALSFAERLGVWLAVMGVFLTIATAWHGEWYARKLFDKSPSLSDSIVMKILATRTDIGVTKLNAETVEIGRRLETTHREVMAALRQTSGQPESRTDAPLATVLPPIASRPNLTKMPAPTARPVETGIWHISRSSGLAQSENAILSLKPSGERLDAVVLDRLRNQLVAHGLHFAPAKEAIGNARFVIRTMFTRTASAVCSNAHVLTVDVSLIRDEQLTKHLGTGTGVTCLNHMPDLAAAQDEIARQATERAADLVMAEF